MQALPLWMTEALLRLKELYNAEIAKETKALTKPLLNNPLRHYCKKHKRYTAKCKACASASRRLRIYYRKQKAIKDAKYIDKLTTDHLLKHPQA